MKSKKALLDGDIEILQELMSVNADAQSFYSNAQSKVEDSGLKNTLKEFEDLHESAVSTFKRQLSVNGASEKDQKANETMSGKASKLFTNIKTQFQKNSDNTLINDLEKAEDKCLHTLEVAISKKTISEGTRKVLKDELLQIRKSRDHMKELKKHIAA